MASRSRRAPQLALLAAVALAALGAGCQSTCESSNECDADEYCAIPDGDCLTSRPLGFCKARPAACTAVLQPICGCDGKTYDNSCEASKHGSAVAGEGLCGAACGGPTSTPCPAGQFCDLAIGSCGEATPSGTCKAPPAVCPAVSSPVCGCDGVTYDNACSASAARVSVLAAGPCPCGGPTKIACEPGRFCQYPTGACLGPDPLGTCAPLPTSCAPAESPICGCDGVTYANACAAAKQGISVATEVPCGMAGTGGNGGTSGTGGGSGGTGGGSGGNGGAGGAGGSPR